MKKLHRWIALVLVLLLLPVTAMADNENEPWVIAQYTVDQDLIQKGDCVELTIWLDGPMEETGDVTAVVSSFNGAALEEAEPSGGYFKVKFSNAQYMGTGNTFQFRVDEQLLSLTVYECREYTEPQWSDQTQPVVQVGRHDQPKPIAKGESQTVTVWVNNIADFDLQDVTATVTPSAELMVTDNSVTYPLGRIWHGDVAFFDVTVQAFGELTSAAQSLTVDLGYSYEKDGTVSQGSATHTVPLSAAPSKQTDSISASVPNVIISGYDYGAEKISAGTSFDLALEFQNTSAVKQVENIVMTIDPGTALAITSSSNSFHFASLAPGATQSQSINLQALPDAPSAPAVMRVKFSYEYIDNDARQTVTAEQTISLPVYQLDRFELTQDTTFVDAWQFQESFLTLSYINKGKGTVYNVSAELIGDVSAMSKVQHVGNVEAGRSGTIDFIITPEMAGQTQCMVSVTYEDDAMQVMTKEFTFDVFVNEMYVPEVLPEEEIMVEEPSGGAGWVLPVIGAAVAAGVVVLVVVLRKRKKKKSGVVDTFVFADGTEDTDGLS